MMKCFYCSREIWRWYDDKGVVDWSDNLGTISSLICPARVGSDPVHVPGHFLDREEMIAGLRVIVADLR